MKCTHSLALLVLATTLHNAAIAQTAEEREIERKVEVEQREAELNKEAHSFEAEMRAAEARLEEAARHIAELSTRQLPPFSAQAWGFSFSNRPVLGISIDSAGKDGPVEGVAVRAVSPGGAAFAAGIRAGDVITSINGESFRATNNELANENLLDFMKGIEEGDALDVQYKRSGKLANVEVKPQPATEQMFAFQMPAAGSAPRAPAAPRPPSAIDLREFAFWRGDGGWSDMEVVPLSADLGRYFGADKGLLVIRAPSDKALQLRDGDVIRAIDGREPTSIGHVVRILDSYQPGESLNIEIMRDKRKQTLTVDIPDNRQSGNAKPGSWAKVSLGPAVQK
ncbi:MAG: PDZ domain-containing protein [Woeseia sp.]